MHQLHNLSINAGKFGPDDLLLCRLALFLIGVARFPTSPWIQRHYAEAHRLIHSQEMVVERASVDVNWPPCGRCVLVVLRRVEIAAISHCFTAENSIPCIKNVKF